MPLAASDHGLGIPVTTTSRRPRAARASSTETNRRFEGAFMAGSLSRRQRDRSRPGQKLLAGKRLAAANIAKTRQCRDQEQVDEIGERGRDADVARSGGAAS